MLIPEHIGNFQILNGDKIVTPHDTRGLLMQPGPARIGNFAVRGGEPHLGLAPIGGSSLASGESALSAAKFFVRAAGNVWRWDRNAVALEGKLTR